MNSAENFFEIFSDYFQIDNETLVINENLVKFDIKRHKKSFSLADLLLIIERKTDFKIYPQDWYVHHSFVNKPLDLSKIEVPLSQYIALGDYKNTLDKPIDFLPSTFEYLFVSYMLFELTNEIPLEHYYLWTRDIDDFGDIIYCGRYTDSAGVANEGFSIHRHLKFKDNYLIYNPE